MNNLLSYCGLVDARISASDKYLPVYTAKPREPCKCMIFNNNLDHKVLFELPRFSPDFRKFYRNIWDSQILCRFLANFTSLMQCSFIICTYKFLLTNQKPRNSRPCYIQLKSIYSEKATKFCEISTVDLTGTTLNS